MSMMKEKRLLILTPSVIEDILAIACENLNSNRRLQEVMLEEGDTEILLDLRARESKILEMIQGLRDLQTFFANFAKLKPVIVVERQA